MATPEYCISGEPGEVFYVIQCRAKEYGQAWRPIGYARFPEDKRDEAFKKTWQWNEFITDQEYRVLKVTVELG